ncbi:MAG: ROK family protein [Bacteroidales bacterium]|nr:ROK family protein [Bacteroidales bacterium]
MDSKTILLDVGGTFVKCRDGRQVAMPSSGSAEQIAAALQQSVGPLEGVRGIGVAIPGPFDYTQGVFLMRHKFAAVYGQNFASLAGIPDSIPVKYLHDVNAPLLGCIEMLALKDANAALITLGTGLGFSIAIKGKVQFGPDGSPARGLWDLPYKDGILEDAVSARGITAAYARLGGEAELSAKDIAMRAYQGEELALKTYELLGSCLAEALAPIVRETGIDILLFGGQISASLSLFEKPLRDALGALLIERSPEGAVFEGLASLFKETN